MAASGTVSTSSWRDSISCSSRSSGPAKDLQLQLERLRLDLDRDRLEWHRAQDASSAEAKAAASDASAPVAVPSDEGHRARGSSRLAPAASADSSA